MCWNTSKRYGVSITESCSVATIEIKTQNTRYLTDITEIDVQRISAAMSKCSTYMNGHDMAEAISGAFPDIDELENDLDELENYFKELKKRRN